jgi:hypothetical protein
MTIQQAWDFMGCSMFVSVGIISIVATILVVNNLFSKFWKPINLYSTSYRFVDVEQEKPNEKEEGKNSEGAKPSSEIGSVSKSRKPQEK